MTMSMSMSPSMSMGATMSIPFEWGGDIWRFVGFGGGTHGSRWPGTGMKIVKFDLTRSDDRTVDGHIFYIFYIDAVFEKWFQWWVFLECLDLGWKLSLNLRDSSESTEGLSASTEVAALIIRCHRRVTQRSGHGTEIFRWMNQSSRYMGQCLNIRVIP